MFQKGQAVRQIMPAPVEGVVAGYDVDQNTGTLQVRVEWTCDEGHVHSRHFAAADLEAVAAPAAE